MGDHSLLVGYHGEPKVNLFHNVRIIQGLYYPKRVKVTYSTTRYCSGVETLALEPPNPKSALLGLPLEPAVAAQPPSPRTLQEASRSSQGPQASGHCCLTSTSPKGPKYLHVEFKASILLRLRISSQDLGSFGQQVVIAASAAQVCRSLAEPLQISLRAPLNRWTLKFSFLCVTASRERSFDLQTWTLKLVLEQGIGSIAFFQGCFKRGSTKGHYTGFVQGPE